MKALSLANNLEIGFYNNSYEGNNPLNNNNYLKDYFFLTHYRLI